MANGHGGRRRGAGRPLNPYRTAEVAAKLLQDAKDGFGSEKKPTPLEYLLRLMWADDQPFEIRFDAAKSALPYCHPRLQSVTVTNPEDNKITIEFRNFQKPAEPVVSGGQIEQPVSVQIEQTKTVKDHLISQIIADELDAAD